MKTNLFQKGLALLLCAVLLLTGIPAISLQADAATADVQPQPGSAYKMAMDKNGEMLYFNGNTESETVSYRLATTTNESAAVDVFVEAASGGYRLYFMNGSTKTYIRIYERTDDNPGYGKGSIELVTSAPAEILTYDTTARTFVYTADDGENAYYMGTYGTYTTFSVSNTYYITGDNAANVDVSQYPARFYPSSGGAVVPETTVPPTTVPSVPEPEYVDSPSAGVAYKMAMYNGSVLYFNGATESESVTYRLDSTTNEADAVNVYLESASGGYRLYFMDGNTKTYIRVYERTDDEPGYGKGSIELVTTAPAEVFAFDYTTGILYYTADDGENAYYMGTYSNYTTFSVSNTYYISGDNAANIGISQFPARLYATEGEPVLPDPPVITAQPKNQNALAGKTAKFTVSATGTGLSYQWQYRTSSTDSWKNTSATGNKTATLSVAVTAAKDGYQYRCKITDSSNQSVTSNAAILNAVTLKVTTQPANDYVPAGKTAKFTVKATGEGLSYQWQYRTSSTASWKNTPATGNKTATLSVDVTAAKNGYQYRCKITDKYGNVINSNAATLKVVTLKVTTQPANRFLPAGKTANFTVKATGEGLTYQWQYRTSATGAWKNSAATGNKTATMKAAVTAAKNGYQYRCKITDKYGNVIYSNVATLKVVTLKITTQPASKTLAPGKTATFTVKATGTSLKYQWQYRTSATGAWKNSSGTGNKTATLKPAVTASKNGWQFRCKITDSYGNVIYSNVAKLTVQK